MSLVLAALSGAAFAEEHTVDVACIGFGPAGAGAAMYLGGARLKRGAVVFDRAAGGAIVGAYDVINWPGIERDSGIAIMDRFISQVRALGVQVVDDVIESIDFSVYPYRLFSGENGVWNAYSVIIATGSSPRRLNIPGEGEYWGRGVATCALCEAAMYGDKDVVVIGGGDSAIDKALHLAKYARTVTVYVRQKQMRAKAVMQERLGDVKERVRVVLNREILEIIGDGEKVIAIKVKDTVSGEIAQVPIDGVFLAIGHAPNTDIFKDGVSLTTDGYIMTRDGGICTDLPGVFAAGSVTSVGRQYNQAFIEAGFGGMAGIEAVQYIRYGLPS